MALPSGFVQAKIQKKNPLVSVVIPTYNEEHDIIACLESLKRQTYHNHEVIVVDDGSTDRTIELINRFGGVKVIRQAHQGPGAARNLGAQKAKGEVLVLIDADMVLFPDYIEKLIKPIVKREALGTIESIQYNIHDTKMQECWGSVVRTVQLEGVNSATVRGIGRKDFLALGGFDKKYGYADDRTFFLKYGIRFLILKDVKCYHKTPPTFKGVYKHSRWIGASLRKGIFNHRGVRIGAPVVMAFIFPIAIPILSIRKCIHNKNIGLLPWMLVFMVARYFGTIAGFIRSEYLGTNTR